MECEKCRIWEVAAKMMGYSHGMCEKCFDERYVPIYTDFELPVKKNDNDKINR